MRLLFVFVIIGLLFCSEASAKTAFIISISTAAIEDPTHEESKKILLARLASIGQSQFKDALYMIDNTATGGALWEGSGNELFKGRKGKELLEAIKRDPAICSNLTAGFEKIESRISELKYQSFDEIHIVVFSGLIDTKCPVPLPDTDINEILQHKEIRSIHFLNVEKEQIPVWSTRLEPTIEYFAKQRKLVQIDGRLDTLAFLGDKPKSWVFAKGKTTTRPLVP